MVAATAESTVAVKADCSAVRMVVNWAAMMAGQTDNLLAAAMAVSRVDVMVVVMVAATAVSTVAVKADCSAVRMVVNWAAMTAGQTDNLLACRLGVKGRNDLSLRYLKG